MASCVNQAKNGDTVRVAAGSATWSSEVSISGKNISVIGAGSSNTIISSRSFALDSSASRISGFTFNQGNYLQVVASQGFRIDNNIFSRTSYDFSILLVGTNSTAVEGLIDHNTIRLGTIVQFGEDSGATAGSRRWAEPLNLGSSHYVYIEDNYFENLDGATGGIYGNGLDGNWGERVVARFNTFLGSRIEAHSLQGDNQRAARAWEFYNNTMTNPANPNYRPYFIRGGTGMIFHNTTDGRFMNNEINIDNARSFEVSIAGQVSSFGMCGTVSSVGQPNGNSRADANTPGQFGWPCRDQIGRSTDATYWSSYATTGPAQASAPAFIWKNTRTDNSTEIPVHKNCDNSGIDCNIQANYHLVESRDFYSYRASFNGTAGVGEGTLANRPTTCTTGVGYWATDQGEWNSRQAGPDGQLYRCTATNTWSLYYTPFTYPHPLQTGASVPSAPAAPTNVRVIR